MSQDLVDRVEELRNEARERLEELYEQHGALEDEIEELEEFLGENDPCVRSAPQPEAETKEKYV